MTPTPTGELKPTTDGYDLVLTRTFRAPVDDVWASVTEPERTARWFGRWRGEPGPGNTIEIQLAFEEGAPWSPALIEACDPPHRLALAMSDESGDWRQDLVLTEAGDETQLQFIQHLTSTLGVGDMGPGWEYYLDLLVASRDGSPQPEWDSYYPSMTTYYEQLVEALG